MPRRKHGRAALDGRLISPRQLGLAAFRQRNYTEAIRQWSQRESQDDLAVRQALAEAHFRRGLASRLNIQDSLADLHRAIELWPGEARLWYHYGLTLHRADQVEAARAAYARAADLGLARRGLGFVRGLAEIELARLAGREAGPRLLVTLPWLSEEDRSALRPIAALVGGTPEVIINTASKGWLAQLKPLGQGDTAAGLWEGLAWLATGDAARAQARLTLPKGQQMRAGAESVRVFYHGLAAAASGQPEVALNEWTEAARGLAKANRPSWPRLAGGLAALKWQQLQGPLAAGRWARVLQLAQAALAATPNETSLLRLSLTAWNRLAQSAVEAEDWPAAIAHWQAMREVVEGQADLGPLPPLLRNLAIAREALEQWQPAAEAWAALLKTLPRRSARKGKPAPSAQPTGELRAWLRRRILDNYQRAGQPDQAIAYYKQAVKAAPDDLDLRLELVSALLANEQVIAARNEAQRILDRDSAHVGAWLLQAEIHQAREEWFAAEEALRRVLEIDPAHEAARRGLAQIMRDRGVEAYNAGRYDLARAIYTKALAFSPADAQLLVFLAETEWVLKDEAAAHGHFETALATGKPEAYVKVFDCWLKHDRENEARQVLARAEAAGVATPHLCVDIGVACLTHGAPPPSMPDLFRPPKPRKAAKGKWEAWGRELIERGLAGVPNRGEVLRYLVSHLGLQQPALGIEYARQLIVLEPQDPTALVALGMVQALSQDTPAAKETLRKAEQMARKQGRSDLARDIHNMRQEIGSPLFGLMGPLLSSLGPEMLDDLDDLELFR
ncbi:MAG: tetratricopeptide repeat protein [Anaerolineales bacterium]|nr:tetratricopeptide repeat protein [Anaerolineales bacterium]